MNRLRTLAVALALPLAASCTEYEFSAQHSTMAFDREADVIEFTMETSGIYGTSKSLNESDDVVQQRAADRLRRMAEGERYFHFLTIPFVFDLDDEESETEDDIAEVEPLALAWAHAIEQVSVVHAELYADENGDVGIRQRVRIGEATALIELIDESIRALVQLTAIERKLEFEEGGMFSTEESLALLAGHVESGARWIELDEAAVEIHVPMTARDLGHLFRDSLRACTGIENEDLRPDGSAAAILYALVHGLDEIEVDGDVVTFRYPFGDDGLIHWRYRVERHEDARELRARFADDELEPGD